MQQQKGSYFSSLRYAIIFALSEDFFSAMDTNRLKHTKKWKFRPILIS